MSYASSSSSPQHSDFIVLHGNLQSMRRSVQAARSNLAEALHRLGEHHVRHKEYDNAMDAFAESLHEKRSAYATLIPSAEAEVSSSPRYHGSASVSGHSLPSLDSTASSSGDEQVRCIDDIASTLSSMGNVHSLRGEHEEAMRYYNEVMTLRASRSSVSSRDAASTSLSGSSMSGTGVWGEEDSTILTELNEDLRALDDLFKSISFRNGDGPDEDVKKATARVRKRLVQKRPATSQPEEQSREKRKDQRRAKSTPSISSGGVSIEDERNDINVSSRQPRTRHSAQERTFSSLSDEMSFPGSPAASTDEGLSTLTPTDSENGKIAPLAPSSSTLSGNSAPESDCVSSELLEAIKMFRSIIDTYTGQNLETHERDYASFCDRVAALRRKRQTTQDPDQPLVRESREEDLCLALVVYNCILTAQRDMATTPLAPSVEADDQQGRKRSQQASAVIASTLIALGSLHYKLNNVDEELRMYREALTVYMHALGEDHTYVAGTRKNIGMVLAERSDFDGAMRQFEKARQIYLTVHKGNERCRDVASAISCMGNVQNRRGELDQALASYKEALGIYKHIAESGGSDSSEAVQDAISTLKIIGMVYAKRGELDEAMDRFEEAMHLLQATATHDSGSRTQVKVASIITRMGGIMYRKGHYDDAMLRYREAYDLTTKAIGTTDHPDVAGILHYIGGIHQKRAEFGLAMAKYKEAVKIYHRTLGPDNPAVATTLVCIGSIHYKKKNLDNAMIFYKEALRLNRTAYGQHHPDIIPTLKSIGMIHLRKGEYNDAMEIFVDVLRMKCAVLGTCHPDVASAYKNLGNVHFKRGEFADAERQYRHALSIYRKTVGETHPDTESALSSIKHIREKMKKDTSSNRGSNRRRSKSGETDHDEMSL